MVDGLIAIWEVVYPFCGSGHISCPINKVPTIPVENVSSFPESRTFFLLGRSGPAPSAGCDVTFSDIDCKIVKNDLTIDPVLVEAQRRWLGHWALVETTHMSFLSVHTYRALRLKSWNVELMSNKHLIHMPFKGQHLSGPALDVLIKDVTGGKSTPKEPTVKLSPSLTVKKRPLHFSSSSTSALWTSNPSSTPSLLNTFLFL